jgi:hypothetical protein
VGRRVSTNKCKLRRGYEGGVRERLLPARLGYGRRWHFPCNLVSLFLYVREVLAGYGNRWCLRIQLCCSVFTLLNHMFSTKKAQEAGKLVGLFKPAVTVYHLMCGKRSAGRQSEELPILLRGKIRYKALAGQPNYNKTPTSSLIATLHHFKAFIVRPQ